MKNEKLLQCDINFIKKQPTFIINSKYVLIIEMEKRKQYKKQCFIIKTTADIGYWLFNITKLGGRKIKDNRIIDTTRCCYIEDNNIINN